MAQRGKGSRVVSTTTRRNPAAQNRPQENPFPHPDPNYPVQKVIMTRTLVSVETLAVKLPTGEWIAVELRPGNYATGRSRAEAEQAVRRRVANPANNEDTWDAAVVEARRSEPKRPFQLLRSSHPHR